MKMWKRYLILAGICAILGIITGSLFRSSYYDELKKIFDIFFENIKSRLSYMTSSERAYLLLQIVFKRARPFIILWLLSGLPIVRLYIAWLWGIWGYAAGFVCCFLIMAYRSHAALIIAAWGMPQIILYGIAYAIAMLYIINEFRRKRAAIIIITAVLMIIGCVCEAYVNPNILSII